MITFAMFVGRLRNFVTHTAINFWMWPTTSMFTLTSLGWARDQQLPCSFLLRWGEHVTNNFHVHSYFVGVSTWPTTSMFILTSLVWARYQQLPCSFLLRWGEHVTNNFHVHSYIVGVSTRLHCWCTTVAFIDNSNHVFISFITRLSF